MKKSHIDWCPVIPDHWEEKRIKDIAFLQSGNSITAMDIAEEGKYPVYGGNGLRGYTNNYTNDGDYVLIGRQGALCGNINYAYGKFYATEHAVVVYTKNEEITYWLGETLKAANLNRLSMTAAQPGLAVSTLNIQFIPYPPRKERIRIANYLAEKSTEIDTQVSLLTSKRDAYLRLKKSIINHAVTHGLNPNVKMKDSGIEWIGEVPEHWEVKRMKELSAISSGTTPKSGEDKYYENGIHPWLNTSDVQDCVINEAKFSITDKALNDYSVLKYYPIGTILIAMYGGGTIGNVALMNISATINQACCAIVSNEKLLLPKYLFCYLKCHKKKIISLGFGGTQVNLSQAIIAQLPVVLPPLPEQRAIATYLDDKCAKIDTIVSNLDKQISRYGDLKRSLIDEVITGKRAV